MKTTLLVLLLSFTGLCSAQTKVIAHKSHSGNANSFSKAYKNSLFDMKNSNFGLPGNMSIFILDTVISVNDSITAYKYRESKVCYQYGTNYKNLKNKDFNHKTDTIVNHPELIKGNTVEHIKASRRVALPIWYQNPLDEVVFIGFRE
ncbi:MAG: hypothetical protein ACK4K0_01025 [Flavobacteriales bacterium]